MSLPHRLLQILTLRCEAASELTSRRLDEPLPLPERLACAVTCSPAGPADASTASSGSCGTLTESRPRVAPSHAATPSLPRLAAGSLRPSA